MSAYCTVCPCLFIVCMGTTPGSVTASYGWTSHQASLTSYSPEFHPEAQAGAQHAGWKKTVASVITTDCTQGWLSALSGTSPSLSGSGAQAEDARARSFPWPVVSLVSMLNLKPNTFLWLKQDKGKLPLCTPSPLEWRWPHTGPTPKFSHAPWHSNLVAQNPRHLLYQEMPLGYTFSGCLEKYSICAFFPHLGAAQGSPAGAPLISKQKLPSCGHIWGSTCLSLEGPIPPVSWLMPQPNSASLRYRALVYKGHPKSSLSIFCVPGMSSFLQSKVQYTPVNSPALTMTFSFLCCMQLCSNAK